MEKRCYGCMRPRGAEQRCRFCGWVETDQNGYHQLPAGTVLHDQYRLGRVLGQGGFGITYLGWNRDLAMPVAIKEYFPRSQVGRDQGTTVVATDDIRIFEMGKERFLKEARTLAKLQKLSNIVRVQAYFQENNTAYIVMELIEGVTLKEYIRQQGGKLSVRETFRLLEPALHTLEQVHKVGMIHRDISPDNIMIQTDGTVKLLDFGTARDVDMEAGQLTHSTMAVMKRGYTPLEQLDGGRDVDQRADEYALCGTIYFCLTGQTPPDIFARLRGEKLEWEQIPGLSPQQIAALKRGCAVQAEERFPDLEALESALYSQAERKTPDVPKPPAPPKAPAPKWQQEVEQETVVAAQHIAAPKEPEKRRFGGKGVAVLIMAALAIGIFVWMMISGYYVKDSEPENTAAETEAYHYGDTVAVPEETQTQATEAQRRFVQTSASAISASMYHSAAVEASGTVVTVGSEVDGRRNVSGWRDIVAVSAGMDHTVGLKADGTAVAVGMNRVRQCDVTEWQDIVDVSAGRGYTIGLKSDGTVVYTGTSMGCGEDVSGWQDIVAITAGYDYAVGIKSDGKVVAAGWNYHHQCEIDHWEDIVAVSAGFGHTVGLKSDGTVVAQGLNSSGQCNVADWTDIVAVSAGRFHTLGLKADGTVVATGDNEFGQCNVSEWTDIIALSAGHGNTLGQKGDGTVVAVGWDVFGQSTVSNWKNIRLPDHT